MNLYESFSNLKDPRRAEGLRTSIEQIFCMVTLSYLCGYTGYRPVAKFSKIHEELFTEELGLKHGTPSHVTFRDVLMRVEEEELIKSFNLWAGNYAPLEVGDWVSGDGKALGSTVTDAQGKNQDFQAVVSIFCHGTELVRLVEQYRNAKESEIVVVRGLLDHLKGKGLIIRLDALHTQKKRLSKL